MHSHFPGGNGGVRVLLGMGPGSAKNICGSNEGCSWNKEPRCQVSLVRVRYCTIESFVSQ